MGGVGNGGAEHLAYITITLSVYQSPDGVKKERKTLIGALSLVVPFVFFTGSACFLALVFAFVSVSVVVSANDSMKELMQKSLSLSLFSVFLFLGGGGEGEEICFLVESHLMPEIILSVWKNGFIARLS
jgi:hypothetical protein